GWRFQASYSGRARLRLRAHPRRRPAWPRARGPTPNKRGPSAIATQTRLLRANARPPVLDPFVRFSSLSPVYKDTDVADVVELIDALDLRHAIHVGHSTGGGEVARYVAPAKPGPA